MKIVQLLSGYSTPLSNEEKHFCETHQKVKITTLDEHQHWLAQNLVRKGVYSISKDNDTLTRNYK